MTDTNAVIEENEQNVGEYDPNPYDNVTVEEALKQLFNRFTPRTVRQAIFTMAENNKPATLIAKSIAENGEYTASTDNADGYSKVTVDVAGSSEPLNFQQVMFAYNGFDTYGGTSRVSVVRNELGLYDLTNGESSTPQGTGQFSTSGADLTLCIDPVVRLYIFSHDSLGTKVIFTPASGFEGIFDQMGAKLVKPEDVTAGDNRTYMYVMPKSSTSGTLTKSSKSIAFDKNMGYAYIK